MYKRQVQNSVSGGEIFLNDEYKGGSSLMQVEPEATFTLKSGTLRATTPKPRSNGITLIENHGTVNIEGGTLTCTQKDGSLNANGQLDDWSSCYALLSQSNSGSVQTTISGGTFTGYVAVSYTHLDVYKRQRVDSEAQVPKEALSIAAMLGINKEIIEGAKKYMK